MTTRCTAAPSARYQAHGLNRVRPWGRTFRIAAPLLLALSLAPAVTVLGPSSADAQDMLQYLDLNGPDFTQAEMTRQDVQAMLRAAGPGQRIDLSARKLNGLDLSDLDLSNANLQSARLNGSNLKNTKLDGAVLDQVWALKSDFSGASLRGASLFATQLMDAVMVQADFTEARIAADMSRANLKDANFTRANLSADMTNQSMGLMRGVLKGANLTGATFSDANMARVVLEYADLRGAKLTGANLSGSEIGGADLRSADVSGANFHNADVNSAKLLGLVGKSAALNLDTTKNLDRAFTD